MCAHLLLSVLNHLSAESGDGGGDLEAGQLANLRAREAVDRVGRHLRKW